MQKRKNNSMSAGTSNPTSGRQRLTWPVVEGIALCAAQIGAPEQLLKAAKKAGSKAFLTGNRVDTGILIPELFALLAKGSGLPDGISTPQDWLAIEKAKREAIKRQQDEKSVMPTADAQRQAAEAMGTVFAELERRDRELPPALAGLPAVEIFKRMNADTESIRKNLKAKFEEVGK